VRIEKGREEKGLLPATGRGYRKRE